MSSRQGFVSVVESTKCSENLPADIRLGFIKKTYSVLTLMLLTTFAVCVPFVKDPDATVQWMQDNPALPSVAGIFFTAFYLFNILVMFSMCFGCDRVTQAYFALFTKVPLNYIFLGCISLTFGLLMGFVCASYTASSVLTVFALSAALIVVLTVYAIKTDADLTGSGMFVVCLIFGLIAFGMLAWLLPHTETMQKLIAAGGAMIFGFIIVYDTQMIFGSGGAGFGGSSRRSYQYTIDMYAFAAFNLYLDFINFFLYMLQLFGDRRR